MSIRVLIVDDSKAMCHFLNDVLSRDEDLEVVGYALDPYEARAMIKTLRPDVLTLDVEMPRMDGLTFLRNLMRLHPLPVVMLSSLTAAGAEVTLEALSIGAVDFMVKRHPGSGDDYRSYVDDVIARVKSAGTAKTLARRSSSKGSANSNHPGYLSWARKVRAMRPVSDSVAQLIAIGASTGGPEAIREVLESMYLPNCSVVVTQHMPARFMAPFARRLNALTEYNVVEAARNEALRPGVCYVAAGDQHLVVRQQAGGLWVCRDNDEPHSGHRPSVDRMFRSVAEQAGASSVGVLLTGMGQDGARGLQCMRNAGAFTVVQDEASSAVWGMPGTAVALDAVEATLSLRDIGPTMRSLLWATPP